VRKSYRTNKMIYKPAWWNTT